MQGTPLYLPVASGRAVDTSVLLQVIALSPVELCSLTEHARTATVGTPKFSAFHDPGAGSE